MKFNLISAEAIDLKEIEEFDLVVLAITGESRAWWIAERYNGCSSTVWVLARKNENLTEINIEAEISRRIPNASIVSAQSFESAISSFVDERDGVLRIFMDVSCMTRLDMAVAIDNIFTENPSSVTEISLTVGYVISQFSPPLDFDSHNEHIKPLNQRFAGWPEDPYASTAIVLGLGYEAAKAEGANEYFDANESWVFSPVSPVQNYDVEVGKNNEQLIKKATREGRLVPYRVDDPAEALFRLNSLLMDLSDRCNPLILPFGPKLFVAVSLIASVVNPTVGVWHTTGDTDLPAVDHEASEHVIFLRVRLNRVDGVLANHAQP